MNLCTLLPFLFVFINGYELNPHHGSHSEHHHNAYRDVLQKLSARDYDQLEQLYYDDDYDIYKMQDDDPIAEEENIYNREESQITAFLVGVRRIAERKWEEHGDEMIRNLPVINDDMKKKLSVTAKHVILPAIFNEAIKTVEDIVNSGENNKIYNFEKAKEQLERKNDKRNPLSTFLLRKKISLSTWSLRKAPLLVEWVGKKCLNTKKGRITKALLKRAKELKYCVLFDENWINKMQDAADKRMGQVIDEAMANYKNPLKTELKKQINDIFHKLWKNMETTKTIEKFEKHLESKMNGIIDKAIDEMEEQLKSPIKEQIKNMLGQVLKEFELLAPSALHSGIAQQEVINTIADILRTGYEVKKKYKRNNE